MSRISRSPHCTALVLLLGCAAPACAELHPAEPAAPLQIQIQAPRPVRVSAETFQLEVDVKRVEMDGRHMFEVDAAGIVRAAPERVWQVLTDYEQMDQFVPDLASCKVLSRSGKEVIIEQFGTARFLIMSKSIHLIVRAQETPLSSIDIGLVSGDMKHYEAHWKLVPLPDAGGTRIVYKGKMMPNFYVPGLIGGSLVRSDIAHMMTAVLARIDEARQ